MANESIKDIISKFEFNIESQDIGEVISVFDGVATISGLQDVVMDEVVLFKKSGERGMIVSMEEDFVSAIIFGDCNNVKAKDEVVRTNKFFQIPVSNDIIGRVFNGLGEVIDDKEPISSNVFYDIDKDAPEMMERSAVKNQLTTGVKVIDCLIPIGFGQRQLILGDMNTGKTSIALTTMLSLKDDPNVVSIYVSIGQKAGHALRILEKLKENNVKNFILVVANCSDSAAMRYLSPMVGCAMGEYFRDLGKNAILIYDTLSAHAIAYRELSLILKRTPGREAFPGDIFYIHAKLLERAAQMNKKNKGGSLTALPICETLAGDITSYIATNIISITDGQLFLSQEEFLKNLRPAVKTGISVSRIGGDCQYNIVSKLAGSIKIQLAQFEEFLEFTKFSSTITSEIQNILNKGYLIRKFLQQGVKPVPIWKQILLLYGLKHNLFYDENSLISFEENIEKFSISEKDIINGTEDSIEVLLRGLNV